MMANFDDLPDEIALKIFAFLPQPHLQRVVTKVCGKWRRIGGDTSLYASLLFDSSTSLKGAVDLTTKYASHVASLHIAQRSDTNEILKLVPRCVNLRSLTMNSCGGCATCPGSNMTTEVNADLISRIIERNAKLTRLRIGYSMVKGDRIRIGGSNGLRELVLKNAYYNRSIEEAALLRLRSLKVLNLRRLIVSNDSLCEVIRNNRSTLETLKLDVWEPQLDSNDDALIEAISNCVRLRELCVRNLSFYAVSERSIRSLAKLASLTTLKFSKMDNISSQTFVHLFAQPQSANLTKISLSACDGVDHAVVLAIADYCPALRRFALHQPKSVPQNMVKAKHILHLATKCRKLRALDLCYTHPSVEKVLARVAEELPDLRQFKYLRNSGKMPKRLVLNSSLDELSNSLKRFDVVVSCKPHFDEILVGTRNDDGASREGVQRFSF